MIAWDAPAAEIGNSPTTVSQKGLRKTLLVTPVSSMASGNSLTVWPNLSRSWLIVVQDGRRLRPRMTDRTLPAAKSEPVCRSELIRVA